jgi:hypothetical protein
MNMTPAHIKAIENFAANGPRETYARRAAAAVAAFHAYIDVPKAQWNDHMRFMSEADSPMPDLLLKHRYRHAVLKACGRD